MKKAIVAIAWLTLHLSNVSAQEYLEFLYDEDLTYLEKVDLAEQHFDIKGREKHSGYKQFLRWQYHAHRHLDDEGYVLDGSRLTQRYDSYLQKQQGSTNRTANNWSEIGPMSATNTSTWSSHIGRLTSISIDPSDDQHLIVTSPGGGVWESTDEGLTWTPIFDDRTSMNCYSSIVSHASSMTYIIGTSGLGLQKTTDGGTSWTNPSGIPNNTTVYDIIQHPVDPLIYLAVAQNGRIYRSIDGGDNWTESFAHGSAMYDLEFRPGNPMIVYASGRDTGIFRSTDGGLTFSALTVPFSGGSIMMAVTPADPLVLYVLNETGGGFGGLYLSTDGGATFTTQSDDSGNNNNIMGYSLSNKGGQAPRDMDVIVSPSDATEVHVAGIDCYRSYDSGVTWTQTADWVIDEPIAFVHADIDQMTYHVNGKIYVASDGGIFISDDQADSFSDRTTGLGIRQFYRIGASTTQQGRLSGGSQDNGTGVFHSNTWYDFVGADGMETVILNDDEDVVIGSIQFGGLYKSLDGGQSLAGIQNTEGGSNGRWVTPLILDQTYGNTIYQAKQQVYKSSDAGNSWQQMGKVCKANASSDFTQLAIAPSDSRVIYVADGGTIYKTVDGGGLWVDVTPSIGTGNCNYLSVHPNDPDKVLMTSSNGVRLAESIDGGITWVNRTHNLPGLGANCAIYDGAGLDGIYMSMSRGVYYIDNTTPNSWTSVTGSLPMVNMTELQIVGDKLYAASYGRGAWVADIVAPSCHLNTNVVTLACDNAGTFSSADDTFTFTLNPTGLGLSTTYSVSGGVTQSAIPYGSTTVFDNGGLGFPLTSFALTVTDDSPNGCSRVVTIVAPPSCPEPGPEVCTSAQQIFSGGVYSAPGPSSGNGANNGGADHANWYKFVPPADGVLDVYSCNGGVDTRVHVYQGDCGSLVSIGSSDDDCQMSPGANDWASEVLDLSLSAGSTYFIEWDNRWSTSGFDFTVDFTSSANLEECPDYTYVYLDGLLPATYRGQLISLAGVMTTDVVTQADSTTILQGSMTASASQSLSIQHDICYTDEIRDWRVIGGGGRTISDNQTMEVVLPVPPDFVYSIIDVNIEIDLLHTYLGDLTIDLVAPDMTTVRIWDRYCGGDDNLHIICDEDVPCENLCGALWTSGVPANSPGSVPKTTLDVFDGLAPNGDWKVRIQDHATGDTGSVRKLVLYFEGM